MAVEYPIYKIFRLLHALVVISMRPVPLKHRKFDTPPLPHLFHVSEHRCQSINLVEPSPEQFLHRVFGTRNQSSSVLGSVNEPHINTHGVQVRFHTGRLNKDWRANL